MPPDDLPRRFSWPMRIFLGSYIGHMVFSCAWYGYFQYRSWAGQVEIQQEPLSLPTSAEMELIERGEHPDGYTGAWDRGLASLGSLGRFFLPGSDSLTSQYLADGGDFGPLALTWAQTRVHFLSRVLAINQQWVMFSPEVATEYPVPRFELFFEDGQSMVHRSDCDPPEDLLQPVYPFWLNEKRLQICYNILTDPHIREGYAHYLSQEYAQNDAGSPLVRASLYRVLYRFHPPNSDASEWYARQSGPPAEQVGEPTWIYEAER